VFKYLFSIQRRCLAVYMNVFFPESDYLQSTPTCLAWQPDCEHSITVGTETGQIVSCDTRFGVGRPVTIDVHERRVHRIAFSSQA
jgi:hypothetical protein